MHPNEDKSIKSSQTTQCWRISLPCSLSSRPLVPLQEGFCLRLPRYITWRMKPPQRLPAHAPVLFEEATHIGLAYRFDWERELWSAKIVVTSSPRCPHTVGSKRASIATWVGAGLVLVSPVAWKKFMSYSICFSILILVPLLLHFDMYLTCSWNLNMSYSIM